MAFHGKGKEEIPEGPEPVAMKTIHTMEEARQLRAGEAARCKIPMKMVLADDFECDECHYTFSSLARKAPRFCPGCGASL